MRYTEVQDSNENYLYYADFQSDIDSTFAIVGLHEAMNYTVYLIIIKIDFITITLHNAEAAKEDLELYGRT